ncbi:MAG: SMI1/KNR4 family protein [Ruminococcus flavefaciens]|nr:SMI1/KNR4 family protein [Ruminococcus flavefaciens]
MRIQTNTIIKPLPDEILIKECERKWRLTLPNDYKEFIEEYNGVIPEEKSFIYNSHQYAINRFLCILKEPSNSSYGWYDISVVESQIGERLTSNEDLIGVEVLPIVELFAGDYICIDFRESLCNPSICIWEHENSGDFDPHTHKVANSFSEFLKMLQ